jgi:hypothetical protein
MVQVVGESEPVIFRKACSTRINQQRSILAGITHEVCLALHMMVAKYDTVMFTKELPCAYTKQKEGRKLEGPGSLDRQKLVRSQHVLYRSTQHSNRYTIST